MNAVSRSASIDNRFPNLEAVFLHLDGQRALRDCLESDSALSDAQE
ncbi:hypothetical protein [Candidatus Villigracilis saccharophilus]